MHFILSPLKHLLLISHIFCLIVIKQILNPSRLIYNTYYLLCHSEMLCIMFESMDFFKLESLKSGVLECTDSASMYVIQFIHAREFIYAENMNYITTY